VGRTGLEPVTPTLSK